MPFFVSFLYLKAPEGCLKPYFKCKHLAIALWYCKLWNFVSFFSSKPSCARKYVILVRFEMQSVSLSNSSFSSFRRWLMRASVAYAYTKRSDRLRFARCTGLAKELRIGGVFSYERGVPDPLFCLTTNLLDTTIMLMFAYPNTQLHNTYINT